MNKYLTRTNLGWLLTGGLTFFFIMSAFGKLTGSEEFVQMFTKHGTLEWLTIVGIGHLVSTILFVYPKTKTLGTLLLSSYFGGAIMAHISHGEAFVGPAVFLTLVWITAWVRGLPWIEMK